MLYLFKCNALLLTEMKSTQVNEKMLQGLRLKCITWLLPQNNNKEINLLSCVQNNSFLQRCSTYPGICHHWLGLHGNQACRSGSEDRWWGYGTVRTHCRSHTCYGHYTGMLGRETERCRNCRFKAKFTALAFCSCFCCYWGHKWT